MGFLALFVSFLTVLFLWRWFARVAEEKLDNGYPLSTGQKIIGPSSGAYYGLFLGVLSLGIMLVMKSFYCVVPALIGFWYCSRSVFRGISKFRCFVRSAFIGCCLNGLVLLLAYGWFIGMWDVPKVINLQNFFKTDI